jgi:hypothetical protein
MVTDILIEGWETVIIYEMRLRGAITLTHFKYYVLIVIWQRLIMDIVHIPC